MLHLIVILTCSPPAVKNAEFKDDKEAVQDYLVKMWHDEHDSEEVRKWRRTVGMSAKKPTKSLRRSLRSKSGRRVVNGQDPSNAKATPWQKFRTQLYWVS